MNKAVVFKVLKKYRRYLLLLAIDIVFFGLISPHTSTFVIIPAFVLIMLTMYVAFGFILAYIGKMFAVKPTNQKRIVLMLTVTAAIIIALQSIGQLTIRDVVTIVPLILVLYLYVSYTKSRQT